MAPAVSRGRRVPMVFTQSVGWSGRRWRTRCWALDGCRPQSSANTTSSRSGTGMFFLFRPLGGLDMQGQLFLSFVTYGYRSRHAGRRNDDHAASEADRSEEHKSELHSLM